MLLVKYSEPLLKSREVRLRLERMLLERIKAALSEGEAGGGEHGDERRDASRKAAGEGAREKTAFGSVRIEKEGGVLRIACEKEEEAARRLQRVFGLASIAVCEEVPADLKAMAEAGVRAAEEWRGRGGLGKEAAVRAAGERRSSFAVRAKRTGEHAFTSEDVGRVVGKAIVDATGLRVDLEKPDNELFVEVRGERAFVAKKLFDGAKGLPLGSQGSMVALLKGSASALAAWMLMRRGCAVIALHARESEESERKAVEAAKALRAWHIGRKMTMLVAEAPSLGGLGAGEKKVAFNRFLARVASEIAGKKRASGIISGERVKLDDNALKAIASANNASALPVHRPLLFLEDEVEEIAGKAGLEVAREPGRIPPFDEEAVLAWEERINAEKAAKEAAAGAMEVLP
ncbi:MAG: THUMP domain-containing protein [Candidatus Micrarchaeia archaeon]